MPVDNYLIRRKIRIVSSQKKTVCEKAGIKNKPTKLFLINPIKKPCSKHKNIVERILRGKILHEEELQRMADSVLSKGVVVLILPQIYEKSIGSIVEEIENISEQFIAWEFGGKDMEMMVIKALGNIRLVYTVIRRLMPEYVRMAEEDRAYAELS